MRRLKETGVSDGWGPLAVSISFDEMRYTRCISICAESSETRDNVCTANMINMETTELCAKEK